MKKWLASLKKRRAGACSDAAGGAGMVDGAPATGTPLPADIKAKMLDELALSRSIVCDGFDVVPRFRVLLSDGDQQIWTPMLDDMKHRLERLSMVKCFMIWKGAKGFIHSGETMEPNVIVCSLVMVDGVLSAYQEIIRDQTKKPPDHASFGKIELIGEVDPLLVDVLPQPGDELTGEQLQEAKEVFGPGGKFEVKPVLH